MELWDTVETKRLPFSELPYKKSKHEADAAVSDVYLISSSGEYMMFR